MCINSLLSSLLCKLKVKGEWVSSCPHFSVSPPITWLHSFKAPLPYTPSKFSAHSVLMNDLNGHLMGREGFTEFTDHLLLLPWQHCVK